MNFTVSAIIWGSIFGLIGMAYFIYGKKQAAIMPLACGIGLMVYPFFVSNLYLLIAIGVGLTALPYFVRL